jgi:purine-binding chemotaxis protein CheW
MDILSARKKAAERAAQAGKKKEAEAAALAEAPIAEERAAQVAEPPAPVAAPGIDAPPLRPGVEAQEPAAPAEEEVALREMEMISFRLGAEEYVIGVDDVKEVLKNRELTALPNAPDYILGVMALRGPIIPVIDLCKRLGVSPGVRDEKSRIMVVDLGEEAVGVIVDRVTGVVKIHPDSIRPVPETIEKGAEYLRGIARKDDKLYILLDEAKALGT